MSTSEYILASVQTVAPMRFQEIQTLKLHEQNTSRNASQGNGKNRKEAELDHNETTFIGTCNRILDIERLEKT